MKATGALEGEWDREWVGGRVRGGGAGTAPLREHACHLAEVVARLDDAEIRAGRLDEDLDPALLEEVHLAREVALADNHLTRGIED